MFTTVSPAGINANMFRWICHYKMSKYASFGWSLRTTGAPVSTMKMANVPGCMMYNQMLRKFISLDSPLSHPNKV